MKQVKGLPEGSKRVQITVNAQNWENLKALGKAAGLPQNWLSTEFDKLAHGLLAVASQAVRDAESRKEMSEEEAKKRYEEMMRKVMTNP